MEYGVIGMIGAGPPNRRDGVNGVVNAKVR